MSTFSRGRASSKPFAFRPREVALEDGFGYLRGFRRLEEDANRQILRRAIRECDVVAGNSRHMSETVERLGGRNVQTVYDGIDRRYYYPPSERGAGRDDDGSRPRVLFAGSFRQYKRAELVVRRRRNIQTGNSGWLGRAKSRARATVGARSSLPQRFVSRPPQRRTTWLRNARRANLLFSERTGRASAGVGQAGGVRPAMRGAEFLPPDLSWMASRGAASSDDELGGSAGSADARTRAENAMSLAAAKHAEQFDWDRVTEQWKELFELSVARRGTPHGKRVPRIA